MNSDIQASLLTRKKRPETGARKNRLKVQQTHRQKAFQQLGREEPFPDLWKLQNNPSLSN